MHISLATSTLGSVAAEAFGNGTVHGAARHEKADDVIRFRAICRPCRPLLLHGVPSPVNLSNGGLLMSKCKPSHNELQTRTCALQGYLFSGPAQQPGAAADT